LLELDEVAVKVLDPDEVTADRVEPEFPVRDDERL
jgi:hypothetical protein